MSGWLLRDVRYYASAKGGGILCGKSCSNYGKKCTADLGSNQILCSVEDLGNVNEWTKHAKPDHNHKWVYFDNADIVAAMDSADGRQLPEKAKLYCARCYTFLSQGG